MSVRHSMSFDMLRDNFMITNLTYESSILFYDTIVVFGGMLYDQVLWKKETFLFRFYDLKKPYFYLNTRKIKTQL